MPMPIAKPRTAPIAPRTAASAAKNPLTRRSEAPRAFMMAKSRRRSKTHPIRVASTQSAEVNDQRGGGVKRGARFVQDVGLAFHDLAYGTDVGAGERLG